MIHSPLLIGGLKLETNMFTITTQDIADIWSVVNMVWSSLDAYIYMIVGTLLAVTVIEMIIGAIRNRN